MGDANPPTFGAGTARHERRKHPRLEFTIPFAYDMHEGKLQDIKTGNVSVGGLLVYLSHEVSQGQFLEMTMRLPGVKPGEPFHARAEVVWTQTGKFGGWACQAGLRLCDLSQPALETWQSFLKIWFRK
jgi:hypothetical protein